MQNKLGGDVMKRWMMILGFLTMGPLGHCDINVTQGSGKTVHTDTVNGVEYQYIKVVDGTTGGTSSATVTSGGALRTSCQVAGDSNTVVANAGTGTFNIQSNASTNLNQVNGSAVTTSGTAGEQKVSCQVAGDSNTVVANAGTGTFNIQSNASINLNQVNGNAVTTSGTAGEQKISVQIAGDSNTVQGGFADNGTAAATNRLTTLPSIYQNNYLNGTAATQGRNGALSQGTDGLTWTANLPALRPASFTASTGTIVPASNATYISAICGNASNTVLVYGLRVSCTETTAGNVGIEIVKTSSTFLGAYTTMTVTAEDSTMNVGVSSAIWFQVNPTNPGPGTGNLNNLDNYKLGCMATGTATPNDIYISPSDWKMKPIVLRGVSQCVAVDLLSTTVTGGSFSTTFDWLETSTISP